MGKLDLKKCLNSENAFIKVRGDISPIVDLQPHAIQPEQFIAWCPETKLESGPLIGGGEIGTRNAISEA